jgi:hypothetical protein
MRAVREDSSPRFLAVGKSISEIRAAAFTLVDRREELITLYGLPRLIIT